VITSTPCAWPKRRLTRIKHTIFPLCRFLVSRYDVEKNQESHINRTLQLDKEDIQWSNLNSKYLSVTLVFLLSWFSYLFLLVKCDFIMRYEAWVNALRASSFIKNVPQISTKPITFQWNLPRKLPRNQTFFTDRFSAKLALKIPRNSSEIGHFFHEFVPENPTKFDFFSTTYQKPCKLYDTRFNY